MSIDTQKLRDRAIESNDGLLRGHALAAADHIDAQAAEIARLRTELEHHKAYIIHRQGQLLYCTSAMRDAYSEGKVRADASEAEVARLKTAFNRLHSTLAMHKGSAANRFSVSGSMYDEGRKVAYDQACLEVSAALSGEGK